MGDFRIKSFRATWSAWDLNWPSKPGGEARVQLPVEFRLELEDGSSMHDCLVRQEKRGRSRCANSKEDVFPEFVMDGDTGERYWWDGKKMANTGKGKLGEWSGCSKRETVAVFSDAPGFPHGVGPLYMGPASGGSGYFDFKTLVQSLDEKTTFAAINWSMRIDIPTPGKGGFWWSFSDQK